MSEIDNIIYNGVTYDIGGSGGEGLSADLKAALDQLAQKMAYIDDDGQDYYNALHSALYPPANLSYISCVYTQSGTVYDTDSLNSLKSDLVVTAHYDNSTSQVVTNYTLSGTLAEGTSTITVAYGGKTTTFNVTVTHSVNSELLDTFTKNTMFSQTDLSNVSASNDHLVASTIKASQVSFVWNTTEAPVFSITIGQYNSSGTPSKLLNHQAYTSSPVTDGSSFDSASWWTDPGSYKWCAIGGGNMTINLPSDGTVKIGLRYGTSGTEVTSNATFWTWLQNGGLTITAHI